MEKLNLTLENLEKLNNDNEIKIEKSLNNNSLGSSSINDLQKDDEISDIVSYIDLENFEKTVIEN